jgi:hypothetical protein
MFIVNTSDTEYVGIYYIYLKGVLNNTMQN